MNKLTKLLSTIFALTLLVALPAGTALAANEASPEIRTLQAGNDPKWYIGTVSVWNDGTNLYVEFVVDDLDGGDWQLLKTQVLATDDNKLKGALATGAPGQFPYEHFPVDDPKFDSFEIPLADLGVTANNADDLIVAFHANVQNLNDIVGYVDKDGTVHPDPGVDIVGYLDSEGTLQSEPGEDSDCPTLADIEAALPDTVFQTWTQAGEGYFQTTISGGTDLDGTYTGWCIDYKHRAVRNTDANVYSSYEPLPNSLTTAYDQSRQVDGANANIDNPDKLDELNWLINNTQRPIDQAVSATNTGGSLQVPASTSFLNTGSDVASTKFETTATTGPSVVSFDGTAGIEQIVLDSAASLTTGDRVRVSANFGGLNATTTYWVRVLDGTTVRLFNSYARAVNTASNDGLRGLNDSYPLVAGTTLDTEDADNESVTFTTDPGWATGTLVKVSASGGGLNAGTNHYVRSLGSSTYSFYSSAARATDSDGGDPLGGRRNLTADITATVYIIVKDADYLASTDDTVTFNASHGFVNGSQVYVTADGLGLDASRLYRLYNVAGADTFSFHTGNPTFNNKVDLLGDVQPRGVYLTTDDTVSVPAYAWSTGMRVQVSQDGGGLVAGVDYYIRVINSTTLAFFATAADASNNVNRIDLTGTVEPALISSWYTDGVVQAAIWNLIDDNPPSCNASCQELVASALDNDGFEPDIAAGEQVAIIIQPVNLNDETQGQVTIGQVTVIDLGLECTVTPWTPVEEPWAPIYNGETAWAITEGDGTSFPRGNNWGLYYEYTVTE